MEQASHEKLKQTKNQSSLERFRCVTCFVVIACLLSCVVFLFVSLVSMENRLRVLERNLVQISEELKALKSHKPDDHKRGFGTNERKIKRRKKAIKIENLTVFQRLSRRVDVLQSTTTPDLSNRLQGLASRVGVLESKRKEATTSFRKLAERVDILENRAANLSKYLETKSARASDDDKHEVTDQGLKQFFGAPCPTAWARFNNYCYLVGSNIMTWDQAHAYCTGLGGELVKINSAEENEFVLALTRRKAPALKQIWIGLKWDSSATQFLWSDHSAPVYKNWAPHEPNGNASEPCGIMWTGHTTLLPFRASGYWNDLICGVVPHLPCGLVCKRLP